MEFPKYDGNIYPDEWINDIQKNLKIRLPNNQNIILNIRNVFIPSIDSTIKLPTGIDFDNIETLRKALKEDISFTIFKNTNKRKLQSLKYIPEKEQKEYLYKSLSMNNYVSNEFYKKMKNLTSINELIKEFEDFVVDESNLIKNESIVALKHIATGKYLSSIKNLHYTTGSGLQMVFVGSSEPGSNSLWRIKFNKEVATYADTSITLQHIKSKKSLGLYYGYNKNQTVHGYHRSPATEHTEVCCNGNMNYWKFNHSKLQNHQGYLKSNDIINLSINKTYYNEDIFLRSHDVQFTIGEDKFQEVVCYNERLGGNDGWCIELIKQYIWTIDAL
ncbi:hypothetical protein C1645_825427 [Glomus cerebriforme]|uniref:MIR domain-containing protein n=1 Tax=Glomus cerebriforme TaxID=658196 RepID=A0A397SVR0_9GLOM|nr:hypothetical protein C1645_825427 [Glomus cerebriforme]